MRLVILLVVTTFIAFSVCCWGDSAFAPNLSVISIAGSPKSFDEKVVMVSGWLSMEIKDDIVINAYLFPTPDHLRVSDFPSSITIDSRSLQSILRGTYPKTQIKGLQGIYGVFKGTFRANDITKPGNLGLGELRALTKIANAIRP